MSQLQKLINQMCPNGVKKGVLLDMLVQPITDGPHETPSFVDEGIPFISAEAVVNSKIDFNKMRGYISKEYNAICCKKYKPQRNDVYVVKSGSTVGKIAIVDFDTEFNIWSPLAALRVNEHNSPRYLYHLLLSDSIQNQIQLKCSKGSQPNLSMRVLEQFEVFIPPLEIQSRIVEILDKFTNLTANLTAELALRRKQFEHYREKLLALDGVSGVEWKTLREVFETRNGYTPSTNNKEFWDNGAIPWFKMEDIREKGRILSDSVNHITPAAIKGKGLFKANSIILATSATIGEHALITVEHLSNQRFTNFYPRKEYASKIDMKFIYFYFFIIDNWCKEHTVQGNFAGVNMSELYNYTIPVPPLTVQQSIVVKLDKFTALIENVESELALRQKQYEYYREQLLTF